MERFVGSASIECHIMFDVVFIAIITDTGYLEDTANEFLGSLHREFSILYRENLPFIKRQ